MLAMLCSNPHATKAVMGNTTAAMRSVVERAEKLSQIARHTSRLAKMPSITAGPNDSVLLVVAMASMRSPTAPLPCRYCPEANTAAAMARAPTKLPTYTTAQLRASATSRTLRLAAAITMSMLPVNNSAPPTTTRMRPSEKLRPPMSREIPGASPVPAVTAVENTAPREMNTPPSTASANRRGNGSAALATPTVSARSAISAGSNASSPCGVSVSIGAD